MSPELTRATMIRVAELMGASDVVFGDGAGRWRHHAFARARSDWDPARLMPDVSDRGAAGGTLRRVLAGGAQRLAGSWRARRRRRPRDRRRMPLGCVRELHQGTDGGDAGRAAAIPRERDDPGAARRPRADRAVDRVRRSGICTTRRLSVASAVPADSPQYRRARFDVALSLIELKRFDGAAKELTALYTQQRSAAVSNALGVTELRRGSAAGRRRKGRRALRTGRERGAGRHGLSVQSGLRARARRATAPAPLSWLREAVRRNAADGDAHLVMGAVLHELGRAAEGQRELDLARLLGTAARDGADDAAEDSAVTRAHPRLGWTIQPSRRRRSGRRRSAISARPPTFHLKNGRTLFDEGRDREAIVELRRAIYLAPYEDEPHLLLGRVYERAGRLAEAIDEFKVAVWCRETGAARLALGPGALRRRRSRRGHAAKSSARSRSSPDSAEARDLAAENRRVNAGNRRATIVRSPMSDQGFREDPAEQQASRFSLHGLRRRRWSGHSCSACPSAAVPARRTRRPSPHQPWLPAIRTPDVAAGQRRRRTN